MKKTTCYSVLISIFTPVLLTAGFAMAQSSVATLIAARDNTIYAHDGNLSNGAGTGMFAGADRQSRIKRALVYFAIADSIPANATIDSVKLTMSMSRTTGGTVTVSLLRLQAAWGEGTSDAGRGEGGGTQATTGDATWTHRFFNTDSWATPGGDFSQTPSATAQVGGNGMYTWGSTQQMVTDVQDWLDDSSQNFGWIIRGDEATARTSKRFDTREQAIASNRPMLTVYYTLSTSVADRKTGLPATFTLEQNYPNPFNPATTIKYSLAVPSKVILTVFNLLGNEVAVLVDEFKGAGEYELLFDASRLTSGVYVYQMNVDGFVETKKLTFIK